jgi:hypothetical protein
MRHLSESGTSQRPLHTLRPLKGRSHDAMSELGRVSRAPSEYDGAESYGPFEIGDQVLKPPQVAVVKSDGGERCGNSGPRFRQGKVERSERKRTVDEVSKAD